MRRRSGTVAGVVFVVVTMLSAAAWGGSTDEDLAKAENAYAALDYGAALNLADTILNAHGLSHDVLLRATRVSALSQAALGNAEQAKKLFAQLLMYNEEFRVDPKLGPRFTDPFAEARGYWQAEGRKPGMDVVASVRWKERGEIRVALRDPLSVVKHVAFGYRWAPSREYAAEMRDASAVTHADVLPDHGGATLLEYYVRGLDAKDNAVFEDGTPELPKSLAMSPPLRPVAEENKSIFASPWLYVVGGAVVAAAAGGYFLLRPTQYTATTTGTAVLGISCGGARCD